MSFNCQELFCVVSVTVVEVVESEAVDGCPWRSGWSSGSLDCDWMVGLGRSELMYENGFHHCTVCCVINSSFAARGGKMLSRSGVVEGGREAHFCFCQEKSITNTKSYMSLKCKKKRHTISTKTMWKQKTLQELEERDKIETPPSYFHHMQKLYEALASQPSVTHLTTRLEQQTNQLSQTRDTVMRLNDELVALEIENNLLQKRVDELTRENEELVGRWMERVKLEVEEVNKRL